MDGMLRGLRVVEGASFGAVAHAGLQMAAWGADLIRVDPLGGVAARAAAAVARGKRSIAIDIRLPRGRALLADVVAGAGAWCTDWPAEGALAPAALAAQRHDLVAVHLPDTGATPVQAGGQAVCAALLAALYQRDRRGSGRHVTLMPDDLEGAQPAPAGFDREFVTRDGERISVDGLADARWYGLLQATGLAGAASALAARLDLNLADERQRTQAGAALAALFRPWFAARTGAQVAAAFEPHRIAWRPLADDRVAAGTHTDDLLHELLGLSSAQIGRLHDERIVAGPRRGA